MRFLHLQQYSHRLNLLYFLLFNNYVACKNTNSNATHQQIPIYNITLLSKTKVINFYVDNI